MAVMAGDMAGNGGHPRNWKRFVALGDSFTEGLCDPASPGSDHEWRGWADRVAQHLADRARTSGATFDYANLAVRGRLLGQIVSEQLPVALDLQPDLVSIIGGGNDVLRPGVDVDDVTMQLESAVSRLRATGATVLMSTSYDPRDAPLIRRTRGRAGVFAANVWSIARRQDALVLDLWGLQGLHDRHVWAPDRIHLTALGHQRVADEVVALLLGQGPPRVAPSLNDPRPLTAGSVRSRPGLSGRRPWREDALWVREYVVPWMGRRLRGRSSGDGLPPKRPFPSGLHVPDVVQPDVETDHEG